MTWPRSLACVAFTVVFSCRQRPANEPRTSDAAARALLAFACEGARCTQRYPRMPDDGEWTCADAAGAAICVGGEPAAGVAAAPPDPAWRCGPRRGARHDALGGRVCTDDAPDFPDGRMSGWRCRYLHDPPPRRACDRDPSTPMLGASCDARRPCLDGGRCTAGRCMLPATPPDCWLDGDCDAGRCRLGHCDEAPP